MKLKTNQIILFAFMAMISLFLQAGDDFNPHQPDGVSDAKWNSLKSNVQQTKLLSADGAQDDRFGYSVSLSVNRALVGARWDSDDNGRSSGSAYIFDYDGVNWIQNAKLTASDKAEYDQFGFSVSLSGDRALVSAMGDDDNGRNSGSAYIFDYDGVNWVQTAKLTAGDAHAGDQFGFSVSLSGNRALVGARFDDDNGINSGSTYIFDYDGVNWVQTAKLTAGDGSADDYFGNSVSLSGNRALVGADHDVDNGSDSGSAYIFDYDGVNWIQTTKLTASDGAVYDQFGFSVNLSGDRALVGAMWDDDNGSNSGSAYIFDYDGVNWIQTAKLTANDGAALDYFGNSVSLSGDRALVGAYLDGDNGSDSGSAYIFDYDGVNWIQSAKLTASDGAAYDRFGYSVSLSGDRALIGAPVDNDNVNGIDSGSAYVFDIALSEYYIGGYIFGLVPDNFMVLQNNNGNDLLITSDGAFVFAEPLIDGDNYSVTISIQPANPIQPCEVLNSTGHVSGDVDNVFVNCEFGTDLIYRHGFDSSQAIGSNQSAIDCF